MKNQTAKTTGRIVALALLRKQLEKGVKPVSKGIKPTQKTSDGKIIRMNFVPLKLWEIERIKHDIAILVDKIENAPVSKSRYAKTVA